MLNIKELDEIARVNLGHMYLKYEEYKKNLLALGYGDNYDDLYLILNGYIFNEDDLMNNLED
jgi:hypothetical protein